MEGCCCAGGVDAGVSDPLTVTRFTMRFALQRGPSGEFCSFSKIKNHPKNFCGQGKGLTGHLQETGTRGSRYQLLVNRSHRGREFVFPASLELVSLPEAGVELLVELAPLLMLGEDTSREYEGAGQALRTRDPPECQDSD